MQIEQLVKLTKNYHFYLSLLSAILLSYSLSSSSQKVGEIFTQDNLYRSNQAYLSNIEKRAAANFVHLAAINATLSTMKTSTVGISFVIQTNLTIGEELEHLENLTAQGAGYSAGVVFANIVLQKLLLVTRDLTPLIYRALLVACLLYGLVGLASFKKIATKVFSVTRPILTLFIICHLVVPYAVHVTDLITRTIDQQQRQENSSYFKQIHQEYGNVSDKVNIKERAHTVLGKVAVVLGDIERKVETMLIHTFEYFIAELLETILMPLSLLYFLFALWRKLLIRYLIHPNELS